MLFSSVEGKKAQEGEQVHKIINIYQQLKVSTENIGWDLIRNWSPSLIRHFRTEANILSFKQIKFLNPQQPDENENE